MSNLVDSLADEIGELFGMDGGEQAGGDNPQASTPEDPIEQPMEESTAPESAPESNTGSEGNGDEGGEPAVNPDSASSTPQEDGGTGTQAPSSPAPAVDKDKVLADALAIIKAQQEAAAAKQEQKPAAAEPEKKEDDIFSANPAPLYQYQIPQKLYNALFSEESTPEERVQALEGYAQGISVMVHHRVMETLGRYVKENFDAVPRVVEYLMKQRADTQSTQSSISASFYKEFPELQKPELGELVKATIRQLQKETKATTWTPAFQTAVGNRIRTILKSFAQPQAPAPKPVTPAPSGVKPAPQVQTKDPNGSDAIADLFSSMFK